MKIKKDDDGKLESIGCGVGFMLKPFYQKKWAV